MGRIKQVKTYTYLGIVLTKELISEKEIRHRISMAKKAFMRKKWLLCDKSDLEPQKKLVK